MNAYGDLTTLKSDAYCSITPTTEDTYLRKLLEYASRQIDNKMGRFFYCDETTHYYDGEISPFWLPDDILSITTLKTDDDDDGTFENSYTEDTDYRLYPLNKYPKTKAKVITSGSYGGFASGIDKGIEIAGVFGYGNETNATPYTATAITITADDATETELDVSAEGTICAGHTIRVESEQIYIQSATADTTKKITVLRAVNGTTGAAHATKIASIYNYPQPMVQACLITAMRAWKRKDSAYQDVVGGGELGTVITSKGIDPDVAEIIRQYRKYRL